MVTFLISYTFFLVCAVACTRPLVQELRRQTSANERRLEGLR